MDFPSGEFFVIVQAGVGFLADGGWVGSPWAAKKYAPAQFDEAEAERDRQRSAGCDCGVQYVPYRPLSTSASLPLPTDRSLAVAV